MRTRTLVAVVAGLGALGGCGGGEQPEFAGDQPDAQTQTTETRTAETQTGRTGAGTSTDPDAASLPDEGSTITVSGRRMTFQGRRQVAGDERATVEMRDFFFEPTLLAGEAGQQLTVRLRNPSSLPHTFTIEQQDVDVVLQPGERGEAQVTFPEGEPLVFVCRFHAPQGMRGALTLGDAAGG